MQHSAPALLLLAQSGSADLHASVGDDGVPDWMADALIGIYRTYANGSAERVSTTVHEVTGAEPRTVEQFAGATTRARWLEADQPNLGLVGGLRSTKPKGHRFESCRPRKAPLLCRFRREIVRDTALQKLATRDDSRGCFDRDR